MIERIKNFLKSIVSDSNDNIIFSLGYSHLYSARLNYSKINNLHQSEYKIFSQNGEDGIIDFLLYSLNIDIPKYLEIGVGDYKESNTRYLFMKNPSKGMIIDNVKNLKRKVAKHIKLWKGDIRILEKTIDSENILEILKENNFENNLDLFSLDIDGIDYWIMKKIPKNFSKIIIAEYNSTFGSKLEVSVPNIKNFNRTEYHHSNLCYGMSLRAIINLMNEKNYLFIGTNRAFNNAFFIDKSVSQNIDIELPNLDDLDKYTKCNILESRSKNGELNFLREKEKLKEISECELINISNNYKKEKVKDLYNI
jgi:hypothetical protein